MELLECLYETVPGRILLKPLTSRIVSKAAGAFLDTPLSGLLIRPFVKAQKISLEDYDLTGVRSFNDFFCRKLMPGKREVDRCESHLIAPCDGLLSVYPIQDGLILPVKQSRYSVAGLLGDAGLAKRYDGGICLVFRLCVHHYHRYVYVDSGEKSGSRFIAGKLHTVRPVALRNVPVFSENCREYTLIRTEKFGTVAQMEVGAMLVGRICNHEPEACRVGRGEEKGMFQYGGSTIIVLVQKDKVQILSRFIGSGEEIPVKLGEMIGSAE